MVIPVDVEYLLALDAHNTAAWALMPGPTVLDDQSFIPGQNAFCQACKAVSSRRGVVGAMCTCSQNHNVIFRRDLVHFD